MKQEDPVDTNQFQATFEAIRGEVERALVGQRELVDHSLVALFARGHVLIEGAPGLGKTLLVRVLGRVLGCEHRRIQFTPDLMPSDVTGGNVFNQQKSAFDYLKGPVFTQLLLADEINRAPAKTQSALLEAMQERHVTVDGITRPLPEPFWVMATQNPIESQGTYPLPEAQLDRFMFKVSVVSPSMDVETAILRNHIAGFDAQSLDQLNLARVMTPQGLLALQAHARQIRVDDGITTYIADIVCRTRAHRSLFYGASPRASIALLQSAQALAASKGRGFVIPDDVKSLAPAVLRHRVGLQPDAEIEGVSADDCVADILREVRVPETIA
jgi:MoxR-like ATPase